MLWRPAFAIYHIINSCTVKPLNQSVLMMHLIHSIPPSKVQFGRFIWRTTNAMTTYVLQSLFTLIKPHSLTSHLAPFLTPQHSQTPLGFLNLLFNRPLKTHIHPLHFTKEFQPSPPKSLPSRIIPAAYRHITREAAGVKHRTEVDPGRAATQTIGNQLGICEGEGEWDRE